MKIRTFVLIGALAGLFALNINSARADKEPPSVQSLLEKEQAQIDASAIKAGGSVAKILSDEFKLKPEALQEIRDGGQTWGEIVILLSMARQLANTRAKDYATYEDALKKVRGLRAENTMPYEKIAERMAFPLPPVLADARRVNAKFRQEKRDIGKKS